MGHYSWRCAKTTQGIPILRCKPTEVVAFLPNGDRVSGVVGNYGQLLEPEFLDKDNQPIQGPDDLLVAANQGVYQLIGQTLTPPIEPVQPDGSMAMADIDRLEDMVKLVLVEHAEPTDSYETLPASQLDPWGGWMYEYEEQWLLELDLAKNYDPMPLDVSDSDDDEPLPGPR